MPLGSLLRAPAWKALSCAAVYSANCPASRDYSRAYLHHLVRANESLGGMLLTWSNLAYYQELMAGIRAAIEQGRYADFMAETQEAWARGEAEAKQAAA